MSRPFRLLTIIALVVGGCDCSEQPSPSDSPPAGGDAQTSNPGADPGTASVAPGGGGLVVKNFEGSLQEAGGGDVFIMRGLEATLKDGKQFVTEPDAEIQLAGGDKITLAGAEGSEGLFDRSANSATITGGVVMEVGDIRVDMDSVAWDNDAQTAKSSGKVTILFGETELTAVEMVYAHADEKVVLRGVEGMVGLTAEADAESPYTHAVFKQPADEMIILGGIPQNISGGVDIALRSPDAEAKPLSLRGERLTFSWDEADETTLAGIGLEEQVTVNAPQAEIHADEADIELATSQLVFSGSVKGRAEGIKQFDASGIVYDLASSNLHMESVIAKGIPLGEGSGGYSAMDIDRAPNVEFEGGEVRRMYGGVRVTLQPSGGTGKPLGLQASEVTFKWPAAGGSPSAINMRGSVQIDLPEGQIRSKTAVLDTRKRSLTFAGGVNGTTPQIPSFECDSVVTNLETGDTHLVNLTAKGVPTGDTGAAPGEQSYKTMDIVNAPDAFMKANRFDVIKGGVDNDGVDRGRVELVLEPTNPEDGTLKLKCDTMTFTFASEEDSVPSKIEFDGNVDVRREEEEFTSNMATLDLEQRRLSLFEDVRVSTSMIKNLRTPEAAYDLVTGGMKLLGKTSIDRVEQGDVPERPDEGALPAPVLNVGDVLDWPGLLGGLQKQSAADKPSPGKRMAGFLKPDARALLATMSAEKAPEDPMKDAVVKALNKILERKDLYDKAAWEGIDLSDAAKELIARPADGLSKAEVVRLNRLLLEAAYPGTIKPAEGP